MADAYALLNISQEVLKDFHLQANRIDDHQTEKIINQNLRKLKEIEMRIRDYNDSHAELILNAMIYHVAKNITALGAVFCGKVDAILLTGGLARSEYVISRLRQRIEWVAPVYCFPGEDEMEALALNALAVLRGVRSVQEYD